MLTLTLFQVDAFTDRLFGGNPAAVLILDQPLSDTLMQSIALENNLSETSFVVKRQDGAWDLRWFTPTLEVGFCGHATLAAAHVLAHHHKLKGTLAFHTQAGPLYVTAFDTGLYQMDCPVVPEQPVVNPPAIFNRLFPKGFINLVVAGDDVILKNYIVELANEDAVTSYVPDAAAITALHPAGLAITAQGDNCDFVSRYFVPGYGIPEDPVTGSLQAALTPYWGKRLGKTRLKAIQRSARTGHIDCELTGDRVLLYGGAVTYLEGTILLPVE